MSPSRLQHCFEKPIPAPTFTPFSFLPSNIISLQIAMSVPNMPPGRRNRFFSFYNQCDSIIASYIIQVLFFASIVFLGLSLQTLHFLQKAEYSPILYSIFFFSIFNLVSNSKKNLPGSRWKNKTVNMIWLPISSFFIFLFVLTTPFLKHTEFDYFFNIFSIVIFILLHVPDDPIKYRTTTIFRNIQMTAFLFFVSSLFHFSFRHSLLTFLIWIIGRCFFFKESWSLQFETSWNHIPYYMFGFFHFLIDLSKKILIVKSAGDMGFSYLKDGFFLYLLSTVPLKIIDMDTYYFLKDWCFLFPRKRNEFIWKVVMNGIGLYYFGKVLYFTYFYLDGI